MEGPDQEELRGWREGRRSKGRVSRGGGGVEPGRSQRAEVVGLVSLILSSASVSLMRFTFLLTTFTNPTVA